MFGVNMMDLGEHDGIFEWSITSCSGFGDPLARDPDRIQEDVVTDRYTRKQAEVWFGVILKDDSSVDLKKTEEKREQLRQERLAQSVTPEGGEK
jgi:N-methylhydantoinase B/oxoprolinase/acetone carboxylase alpha subunit